MASKKKQNNFWGQYDGWLSMFILGNNNGKTFYFHTFQVSNKLTEHDPGFVDLRPKIAVATQGFSDILVFPRALRQRTNGSFRIEWMRLVGGNARRRTTITSN